MNQVPPIAMATVLSQDPDTASVQVVVDGFFGGQSPALPVKVLTHGPRDAVRMHLPELPVRGTRGIVVFPRGDYRNGHWIGSTDPALVDASPLSPGAGQQSVGFHWGGGASWRGPDGTLFEEFPDGTTLQVGPTTPAFTRHTLDQDQARVRIPYGLAQRVRQAVAAFAALFSQSAGASLSVTASGAWMATAAAGQTVTVQISGGASIVLQADGTITLTPSGGSKVHVAGALDVDGEVRWDVAGTATAASTHEHPVTTAPGETGPPTPGS